MASKHGGAWNSSTLSVLDPPALELLALSKTYDGRRAAVDSLNLRVERGEIFGFLGPNGAGKSTTIRILLDLIRPTSGSAQILGLDCQRESSAVKRLLGYLPGEQSLYPNYTAEGLMSLMGALRPRGFDPEFSKMICDRLRIESTIPIGQLSYGNRQKIGILIALMARPPVVILDEPTNGLDPLVQIELLQLLREMCLEGTSVFLSSHNLTEVERICDGVAIIRAGRLVATERVAELKLRRSQRFIVRFSGETPKNLNRIKGVSNIKIDEVTGIVSVDVAGDADPFIKALNATYVISVETQQPSLEDAFLELYKDETQEGED